MKLDGRTVLVTGGSRGIGLALAGSLAARGARVAVCGRSEEAPAALAGFGRSVRYLQCDLADASQVRALPGRVRREVGRPSVLVNNAGVQFNHGWARTRSDDRARWAETELAVNLVAPALLTALLLDDLRAGDPGVVVNVTSLLALAPKPSAPTYCASKAGLRSFTRALRWQLSDDPSVRVVEAVPPLVDTAMTAGRGAGKMDPAAAAERIVEGLVHDETEIRIGMARIVGRLARVSPVVAEALLKRG